jgi:hypothetical protein
MDWIKLAIPLVVLAFWILGHLLRNQQEEAPPMSRRLPPRPDGDPPGTRPRRTTTDVERFLEEVRRRREGQPSNLTQEEEEAETGRSKDATSTRPVPPARPVLPVPRPVEPVQRPPLKRPLLREPPAVVPVPPPAEEVVVARLVAGPGEVAPPRSGPPPVPSSLLDMKAPSAVQLLHFLKSRQSIATAVVLREVFEAPLSRRSGARRGGRA